MKILESLQDRVPETAELQRTVILAPETDASRISAVLVRLPPGHEFPLHTHPRSEDCFFVLAGSGEAFGSDLRAPIAERTGVWIGAGVPHGLAAGPAGMLEIGFQSPPDPTAVPFPAHSATVWPRGMLVEQIPGDAESTRAPVWHPAFPRRPDWQHLDPYYCGLSASQEVRAEADSCELVVVVVRGAVELPALGKHIGAVAALQLGPGEATPLRALAAATLLLAIRGWASRPESGQ